MQNTSDNSPLVRVTLIPLEEFHHQWRVDQDFRERVTDELIRSVSKTGGFSKSVSLSALAEPGFLSLEEVRSLYDRIADESLRSEIEWRGEFSEAFPFVTAMLPEIDREEVLDLWAGRLFSAIFRLRDAQKVKHTLAEIKLAGINLSEFRRVSRKSLEVRAAILCVRGFPEDQNLGWLDVARASGVIEIEELLKESGAK